jgi:hypothetical protein
MLAVVVSVMMTAVMVVLGCVVVITVAVIWMILRVVATVLRVLVLRLLLQFITQVVDEIQHGALCFGVAKVLVEFLRGIGNEHWTAGHTAGDTIYRGPGRRCVKGLVLLGALEPEHGAPLPSRSRSRWACDARAHEQLVQVLAARRANRRRQYCEHGCLCVELAAPPRRVATEGVGLGEAHAYPQTNVAHRKVPDGGARRRRGLGACSMQIA